MWINFFHRGLNDRLTNGHLSSDELRSQLAAHDGTEAYHCAFDCVEENLKFEEFLGADEKGKPNYAYHTEHENPSWPRSFAKYDGIFRPALGYVWFDFDSHDGGVEALQHAREFSSWLGVSDLFICYSGSKGFHVGVPFSYFGLEPSHDLGAKLNRLAQTLKKRWSSIDTTVFNPQRKFRALGSRHPKTGLYKIRLAGLSLDLAAIKGIARNLGSLDIPVPELRSSLPQLVELLNPVVEPPKPAAKQDKEWTAPTGNAAFEKCGFLKHCKDNPAQVNEPQWYAALSIVSRFQEGRKQCHSISHGHPKYSVGETNDKIDQALKESAPRTCENIGTLWDCSGCPLKGKINSPVNIFDTRFWTITKKGALHPQYDELVKEYSKQKKFLVDPFREVVYVWTGTHYDTATETHINSWCEEAMLPAPGGKVVNEFRAKVQRNFVKSRQELDSLFFDSIKGKLNLKNGVLDIATRTLVDHSPSFGFRYVLPYEYTPGSFAPIFSQFIDQITLSRTDLQKTLLEFMGYCLWPSYDDHCFLWLSGGGRNGKSTLNDVIQSLVGEENTTHVSLNQFEKPNYLQLMDHKLVNISEESDVPKIPAEVCGPLKALSSGAKIEVDQKFQIGYSMRPTAKQIFAANKPPLFPGAENALRSRMIVVPFDLQLEEHGEDATQSKINWKLSEDMRAELPGILNLCLDALGDFVRRSPRKIFRSAITHHAMNEIMRDSDPVEAWFQDYVIMDAALKTTLDDLYAHFKAAQGLEARVMEQHWFARRLRQRAGSKCRVERERILGKQVQVFYGITLENGPEF